MTDLRLIDVDAHLIKRQELYFGTLGATPERIASDVAADALVLGCTSVRAWAQDDWWLIAGNLDWLNAPNRAGFSAQTAFKRPWALPEAGQNFHLSAVMTRVFAVATATRCGDSMALIKGTPLDLQRFSGISAETPANYRVIGFRFLAAA